MVPTDVDVALDALGEAYLNALVEGRQRTAAEVVHDAVRRGVDIKTIYWEVLAPAQRALGRLWEEQRISVAQEHYGTATTQLVMSQLFDQIPAPDDVPAGVVVSACVEGDLHEVGLRMATDHFEMAGWRTHYLGANTPTTGILEFLRVQEADVLALSAVMPEYLPQLRALVGSVKERPELAAVRIIVGGRAFDRDPEMQQWVGAHYHAQTPDQALAWLKNPDQIPEARAPRELDLARTPPARSPNLDALMELNNELAVMQRRLTQERDAVRRHATETRQYMGMAVHDLRGALGVVRGLSHQLERELQPHLQPGHQEMFGVVQRSTELMISVVEDALATARNGALPHELERVEARLEPIMQVCLQRAMHQASQRGVRLELEAKARELQASVDVRRLEQILDNLLANAIEASPEGATVRLRLERGFEEATISVVDEGPGLPAGMREDVFLPFVSNDEAGPGRGAGLGLAIVRRLAEAHGGRVEVDASKAGGAAFVVRLPLSA